MITVRLVAVLATFFLGTSPPGSAAPDRLPWQWMGATCDVMAKVHETLTALGEDGTRWDWQELHPDRAVAYAEINGARVTISAQCSDQRT